MADGDLAVVEALRLLSQKPSLGRHQGKGEDNVDLVIVVLVVIVVIVVIGWRQVVHGHTVRPVGERQPGHEVFLKRHIYGGDASVPYAGVRGLFEGNKVSSIE